MTHASAGETVLGLVAEAQKDKDGPVVIGSGRDLRGRVVVSDEARQQVLFPPPSETTLQGIRNSSASMRPDDARLGLIRLD